MRKYGMSFLMGLLALGWLALAIFDDPEQSPYPPFMFAATMIVAIYSAIQIKRYC